MAGTTPGRSVAGFFIRAVIVTPLLPVGLSARHLVDGALGRKVTPVDTGKDGPSGAHLHEDLARVFGKERLRLTTIASRLVGIHDEAEDAVQEARLRLQRVDPASVDNAPAWLTTVVSRICLTCCGHARLRGRARRPGSPCGSCPSRLPLRKTRPN
ncbi:sigma factor [Nocardioides aurantiacus]|uniref:sigma factor n=1 Tax=Nocardioides aurantiacus TaxID=86796 RepID=UPI001B87B439